MWHSGSRPGQTMKQKLLQGLHPRGFKQGTGWRRSLKAMRDGEATLKLTPAGTGITRGQEGHRSEACVTRQDGTQGVMWMPQEAGEREGCSLAPTSRGLPQEPIGPRESIPHDPGQSWRRGRRVLRAKKPSLLPPFLKHYGADPGILDSDRGPWRGSLRACSSQVTVMLLVQESLQKADL